MKSPRASRLSRSSQADRPIFIWNGTVWYPSWPLNFEKMEKMSESNLSDRYFFEYAHGNNSTLTLKVWAVNIGYDKWGQKVIRSENNPSHIHMSTFFWNSLWTLLWSMWEIKFKSSSEWSDVLVWFVVWK